MKLKLRKQQPTSDDIALDENKREIMRYLSKMGIMVPVLLLSILAGKMIMGDMEKPQVVREAIAKDNSNLARRLNFALYLLTNRDARIEAEEVETQGGKPSRTVFNLKAINGQFDLKGIHGVAVNLKQKYPEVFKAIVSVADKISKTEIKKVLESIRKRQKTDPEIFLVDGKSGKKTLLKVMFTEVIFLDNKEG